MWRLGVWLCIGATSVTVVGPSHAGTSATADPASIQAMSHRAWSVAGGAPPNIWGIQQDEAGFIWLATTGAGVVRFDGLKFDPLTPFPGEGFASRDMTAFHVNRKDDMWVGTSDGVIEHIAQGHIINHVTAPLGSNAPVFAFATAPDGAVWSAGHHGVLRFVGDHLEQVGETWGLPDRLKASWIVADRTGTLWLATSEDLLMLRKGARRFERTGIPTDWHSVLGVSPEGTLWVSDASFGTRALPGLTADHVPEALRHPQKVANPFVTKRFAFDHEGAMWGSLSAQANVGGIYRIAHAERLADGKPLRLDQVTDRYSALDGLSSSSASPILVDGDGGVWVGTVFGLDRFRTNAFKVPKLPLNGSSMTWLSPGTHGNPVLLQPGCVYPAAPGAVKPLRCDFPSVDEWGIYRSNQGIFTLVENGLLFGKPGGGTRLQPFPGALTQQFPTALATDHSGNVWLGFNGGSLHGLFSLQGEAWTHADVPGPQGNEPPTSVGFDDANRAWIGYGNGRVVRWDGRTATSFGSEEGLRIGLIESVTAQDGAVLIGGDMGFARLSGDGFESVPMTRLGVPAGVTGMARTQNGDLWLNTTRGIVRIGAGEADAAFKSADYRPNYDLYTGDDGIQGVALMKPTTATISTDEAGRLWFANNEGVSWVDPKAVQSSSRVPQAIIDLVVADGSEHLPTEMSQFAPHTSSITFQYTAASFISPQNLKFRYRLHGASSQWQSDTTNRQATFANLGPGPYTFEVMAANSNGAWGTVSARYRFEIEPAFYEMLRYQVLAALTVLAGLIIVAIHQYHRIVARIRDRLEIRHAERKRIARDMHDTLLQGVQALILTFQAVADQMPKTDPLSRSVEHALDRAEGVLVDGRNRVQDMRKRDDVLHSLPMALATVGEQQSARTGIAFELTVSGPPRSIDPGVSEEAYLIVREAMLNAFRHSAGTRVDVQITYGRKLLVIVVLDNGIGVDPDVMKTGQRPGHWGFSGMRERAQTIGGQVRIWTVPKAGTQVDLTIPARVAFAHAHPSPWSRLAQGFRRWRGRDGA